MKKIFKSLRRSSHLSAASRPPTQGVEPLHQAGLIQAIEHVTISDGARGFVGHVDNVQTMFEVNEVNNFYSNDVALGKIVIFVNPLVLR